MAKKSGKNGKKPLLIAGIGAGAAAIALALGKAFRSMKESAKAQHEVDKANFEAIKAESKASFEENRGHNTYARAKADAKKVWDDAHMSPSERAIQMQKERDEQIAAAKERTAIANERIENARK